SWLGPRGRLCHFYCRSGLGVFTRELVRYLVEEIRRVSELEQELHAREVDPACLGEVPDRANSVEVVVRVQADVRVRADRIEQALLLVDEERPGMAARQPRGDADDLPVPPG